MDRVNAVVDRRFLRGSAKRRTRHFAPALQAAALVSLISALHAGPALPAAVARAEGPFAHSLAPPAATEPLSLTIDRLSPAVIPRQGPIRVAGTITNNSTDQWDNIKLYSLTSPGPLTTTEELSAAVASDPAQPVGNRITDLGPAEVIDTLGPGESSSYSMRIPRRIIEISGEPGVYWFGVQALGEVDAVRDTLADGRARTFLPYVPPARQRADSQTPIGRRTPDAVRATIILPLRQDVTRQPDGRIDQVTGWTDTMSAGGRLHRLVGFGTAAPANPGGRAGVTWLIDPAVADASAAIAAGNLPFDFTAGSAVRPEKPGGSTTPTPDGEASEQPDFSAGASPTPTTEPDPNAPPPPEPGASDEQTAVAATWLDSLTEALGEAGKEGVLSLPYGDLDVAAAAVSDPELISNARDRGKAALDRLGIAAEPAIAPPGGGLPPEAYPELGLGETILVTARNFARSAPERASVDGRILTNTTYAASGPGPNDPRSAVALRQMILSKAALRLLQDEPAARSLVVQFPQSWEPPASPGEAAEFFAGFDDLDWFELVPLQDVTTTTPSLIKPGDLTYRPAQRRRELPLGTIGAAQAMAAAGQTLGVTLTRNDLVSDQVLDAALTATSYSDRWSRRSARTSADRSRQWIERQLAKVTISTPPSLTLSGGNGLLPATVSNGLDYPVTVRITSQGTEPVRVTGVRRMRLAPNERVAVKLPITVRTLGVNTVRLVVTDVNDVPLGGSATLPVRSADVGQVGWLIIGAGVGLLIVALGLRLLRRVRLDRARTHPGVDQEEGAP
ncbi:MAG: DUF6049 family protein [Nocardioides sp.]